MSDGAALVGTALALAVASGLSLYGTALVTGLAVRLGWVHLGPAWAGLDVLGEPLVLGVAAVLFALEFLADKIPLVDSVWDGVHTVIRPVGGALLAGRLFGTLSPGAEVAALLLLGAVTLTTHAAKASTRLAVNASPEPVSNGLVSLAENGLVAGAVWLALAHPLAALAAALVAIVIAIAITVWLGGMAWRILARRRPHASSRDSITSG